MLKQAVPVVVEGDHDALAPPPERFNFARYVFSLNEGHGGRTAYIDDAGALTYAQLTQASRRFASGLLASGIRREERVLLAMLDCREWVIAYLGSLYAGVIPVCVNTLLHADDYAYMLSHSRSQAVFTSPVLVETFQEAQRIADTSVPLVVAGGSGPGTVPFERFTALAPLPAAADTHADDIAFWLYSSGSTGRPKGAVHSHANPYWTHETYGRHILKLREDDVVFSAAKLFFAYGFGNGLTFPLMAGATTVLMAERPTPTAVFKRLVDQQVSVFYGVPTLYSGMLVSPQLPPREQLALRQATSAGEALPEEIGTRFRTHFGCDILDGIGSTEMLHIFISNRTGEVKYGTSGTPVPGYEISLRDERGAPVPDGQIGDLYIKGPSAALVYWAQREKSRATFLGEWTRSGDKYVRDAQGVYRYCGRSDDMLKVSGQYVSPAEVEAELVAHPSVLEAAVIGVEDRDGLMKAKGFVVLKEGYTGSPGLELELREFLKSRLTPHKAPRHIEFLEELPKTATGKVQRFRLREREQGK